VDNNWITDKTVKLLLSDGGILDLDDKIVDVIDDKEQVGTVISYIVLTFKNRLLYRLLYIVLFCFLVECTWNKINNHLMESCHCM